MSKKYILESDIEIPFDKNIKYITIDLQECDKNKLYLFDELAIEQKGAEKAWALARWAFSEAADHDLEEAFLMSGTTAALEQSCRCPMTRREKSMTTGSITRKTRFV